MEQKNFSIFIDLSIRFAIVPGQIFDVIAEIGSEHATTWDMILNAKHQVIFGCSHAQVETDCVL